MLPHDSRLTSKKDFARLFSRGRPLQGRGMGLKFGANGLPRTRVGFVVSTKVSKKAVVRNRLKRRLREAFRRHLGHLVPGADIVIMARKEAADLPYEEVVRTVTDLLAKARLIRLP